MEQKQKIKCFNEDAIMLLESGELEKIFVKEKSKNNLIYLDLPYGSASSDYPKLYSFLEEYIHMKPLAEIEKIQKFNRYAKQKGYEEQFIELLEVLHKSNLFSIWVLSYNESSWKPIDEIVTILKRFKPNITIKKREYQYNYRKNEIDVETNIDLDGNSYDTERSKGKRIGYEFLIICKD